MFFGVTWSEHPLAPVFIVMALLGVIPVVRKPWRGLVGVDCVAWPLCSTLPLCAVAFFAALASALRGAWCAWTLAARAHLYHDKIAISLAALHGLPAFLMPCVWLESKGYQDEIEAFRGFQRRFGAVSSRQLGLETRRLRRRCWVAMVLLLTCHTTVSTTILYCMEDAGLIPDQQEDRLSTYFTFTYLYVVYELVVAMEVMRNYTLALAGRSVVSLLGEAGDARQLRRLRALWAEVGRMVKGSGPCAAGADVARVLYSFTAGTVATYLLLAMSPSPSPAARTALAAVAASQFAMLCLVCHSAHQATAQVSDLLIDALNLCTFRGLETEWFNEVSAFYASAAAAPLQLSLSGFAVPGRPFLASLGSAMATYLIVLLQFD